MKKTTLFTILCVCLLSALLSPAFGQEKTGGETAKQSSIDQIERETFTYNPAGRRDPFRDLLAGSEAEEQSGTKAISEMSIDNIILIGILKIENNLIGIIRGPQGFPYRINEGDQFNDGFVLTIKERQIIFRKTKNRGVPLSRPIDITKEINPQER